MRLGDGRLMWQTPLARDLLSAYHGDELAQRPGFAPQAVSAYDPRRARALLAEAGFPNGFQTVIWTPQGRYFIAPDATIIGIVEDVTDLRELQRNPAQQAASAYMNFLIRPDAAALLAENGHQRLFGFFEGMGAAASPGTPGAPIGAGWLTPEVRAQYTAVWAHGLDGGLNYYRASPLRPATPSDPAANAVQLPPEMLHIPQPTLVLWAQGDIALLPELCEGLEAFVPRMTLVPLPQATHWVVHEQPQRVIAEIARFLQAP